MNLFQNIMDGKQNTLTQTEQQQLLEQYQSLFPDKNKGEVVKELEDLTGLKLIPGPLTSVKTLEEEQNKSFTVMNKTQK